MNAEITTEQMRDEGYSVFVLGIAVALYGVLSTGLGLL